MSHIEFQLSKRLFAWLSSHKNTAYEALIAPRKKMLLGSLKGTIVEIGAGTGPNLHYYPQGINYIAVEPNTFMHGYLKKEAASLGIMIDIRDCAAEDIRIKDGSIDAVVGTLVLCSVANQSKVLREIFRILKPGGTYCFIEHVAAPKKSALRAIQHLLRPCWRLISDGCYPDRETLAVIQMSGFTTIDYESFRTGAPVVSPHIAGRAVK